MSLEGVDDVGGGNGFPAGVLGVGDGVTNDVLEESGKDFTDFLVDVEGDSLNTSSASQASNGGLGDTLNEGSRVLSVVSLNADFADSFSAFSSFANSCHLLTFRPSLLLYRPFPFSSRIFDFIGRFSRRSVSVSAANLTYFVGDFNSLVAEVGFWFEKRVLPGFFWFYCFGVTS